MTTHTLPTRTNPATTASGPRDNAPQAHSSSAVVTASWRPLAILVATAIGIGALLTTAGPLRDVDVFWHTLLGSELASGTPLDQAGSGWALTEPSTTWISTQWLAELLFSVLHGLSGWNGLIEFRMVTTAMALLAIGVFVFRDRRPGPALLAFLPGAFTLVLFAQERPQQLSFVLLPLLGWWWLRATTTGVAPRWWVVAALSAVWANTHGLWVMVPATLVLAVAGRFLDNGRHDPARRPLLIAASVSLVAGCLTPLGVENLLTPLRFASAAGAIAEWQPTTVIAMGSAGLLASIGGLVVAWARGRTRPSRSEILYPAVLAAMGLAAWRNVPVAVLMLAPLLAYRLDAALRPSGPRQVPEALAKVAKPAAVVVAVAGLVLAGFAAAASTPLSPTNQPVQLVEKIAARPGITRVLNGYNVSGLLLWGTRPEAARGVVQVGIDGRADRYGSVAIERYVDMENGKNGWEETVRELAPDVALLPEDDVLASNLRAVGWRIDGSEAGYVLLTSPGQPPLANRRGLSNAGI